MAKVSELKAMIVDLKVQLASVQIPDGNCPMSYFRFKAPWECGDFNCTVCHQKWLDEYRKLVAAEVRKL